MDSWKDAEIAFEVGLTEHETRIMLKALEWYAPKAANLITQAGELERFLRSNLTYGESWNTVTLTMKVNAKETLVMKRAALGYCKAYGRFNAANDIYRELCRVTNEHPKI